MNLRNGLAGALALWVSFATCVFAADLPVSRLKNEMRQPWERGDTSFMRSWKIAGPISCELARDCLDIPGGEAVARANDDQKHTDGSPLNWRENHCWADTCGLSADEAESEGTVAYATAIVERAAAGKAVLSIGSTDGIRVWVNGKPVLARDGRRPLTLDEDQVEVDLVKGTNTLLLKVAATASFSARVIETGAVVRRAAEIGPSIIDMQPEIFTVRTDVNALRAGAEPVKIDVLKPGGDVVFSATAKRGALVVVDAKGWPEGPYEIRASTSTALKLLYVTYLPWFKGNSLAMARALAVDAAKADPAEPSGFTLKMLADMVEDRLGVTLADAKHDAWLKIHSPLMEYAEILLERAGHTNARVRAGGFMRIAYRDEVDGTPQFARAYLPAGYDPARKWPLVLALHGYNPANPQYVRWWSVDSRHPNLDTEFAGHQQVVFIEPHGRGNNQYLGLGDNDVMRVLAEAKRLFKVDENRIYLTGESMGGAGTWNVGTRHPDVFAAIAPVFGGLDYHSRMTEEQIATLTPVDRFIEERRSNWALAEGLNNMPIYVHHGDADAAVNVEWSRWGVKLLQRWGYDVRYREYPGRGHETLQTSNSNPNAVIPWFLEHVRNPDPTHVRLRTPELRNVKSYWVNVLQSASPLQFVEVDAEVADRNLIRLDTQNVLDVTLTPGIALVDASQPIKVVWNGVARDLRLANGALRLSDPAYQPGKLVKNASLPGGINDFTATPFAVVIGTTAKDPEMAQLLRSKAEQFINAWREWQKYPPRVFEDTKITEADIAKYSLLLFGGADANRVTASLSKSLPLRMTKDTVTIDGRAFEARDALVQMLHPNPRNAQRYVWVVAGNSPAGLFGAQVLPSNLFEFDYVIEDGHVQSYKQGVTRTQTAVVSGMFDYNWHYSEALAVPGDSAARAKAHHFRPPNQRTAPDIAVLDQYVGRYRIPNGPIVDVRRNGTNLIVKAGGDGGELLPQEEDNFYLPAFNVWIAFQRDDSGKLTGFTSAGSGDFEARRED